MAPGPVDARPGHRGEQALDRRGAAVADVHEHEAAGAVGVLRHARLEAGLSEQGGLLIAQDARDRHAGGQWPAGGGHAEPTARRAHLGQAAARHAEQVDQLGRPGEALDVEQQRAAGVRRLGGVHPAGAAGQLPQHPGVDGAHGQVGPGLDAALPGAATRAWWPRSRGRAPAGGPAHQVEVPGARSSSQRPAVRRSCQTMRPVPRPAGCAGPTTTVSRWLVMPTAATAASSVPTSSASVASVAVPDLLGVVLDQARGRGKCWGELAVGVAGRRAPPRRRANDGTPVVPASMAITTAIAGGRSSRWPSPGPEGRDLRSRRCSPAAATAPA